jgi:hypothetical protein
LGDLDLAEARHAEALALARQAGRTDVEAFQLGDLANVAGRRGDLTSARSLHQAALQLKVAAGDRRQIAISLEHLAQIYALEGNAEKAAQLIGAASALRDVIGAPQPVPEQTDTEQAVAAARAQMGSGRWNAALDAGRGLPLEEAVAEALNPAPHADLA